MKSVLESSRKSSLYVGFGQIMCQALGMGATLVLARNLTVTDYGVYNLLIGSVLVFRFFTNLGVGGSLQRFLSEYARLGKNGRFFRTFFFSIGYRTISGVVVFTAAIVLFDRFAGFFGISGYKNAFILFCLGTCAVLQIDFLRLAFNALFLHGCSNLGLLAYQALRVGLIIVLLMVLQGGLREVFAGELLAYGFGAVLFWFLFVYRAYAPRHAKIRQDNEGIEWKRFLRFSAYNAATIPGGFLFRRAMDYFVVAAMATTDQLGIYALGARASAMLLSIMPQNILQAVVRPAFYHHYYSVEEKNVELNRMFRALVVMIAAVLFPALALVGLQAEPILTFVFKSKFSESTPVFLMFLAFSAFTIIELPSDLVLQAIEKVQIRLYAQVFAVYNVVAAVFLMREFGLLGVAFATGSALMAKCLFWFFMGRRYTGITLPAVALLKITANTAVATGAAYWVSGFGDSPGWMFASLVAGAFVYTFMSLVNNFLATHEKELVNRLCKRRVFKI